MKTVNQKGFTLVELLVVISIIALLLAILMPSLSKAKQQAREIVCRSRLSQMGIAAAMYADSNKGMFPDQKEKNSSGEYVDLDMVENAIIPGGNDSWARKLLVYMKAETSSLLYCPVTQVDSQMVTNPNWSKDKEVYTISYLQNGSVARIKQLKYDQPAIKILYHDNGQRQFRAWQRVSAVENGWNDQYTDYPYAIYKYIYKTVPNCLEKLGLSAGATWNRHIHGKNAWGRNFLMMDNHVEWQQWGTFLDSYLPRTELNRIGYKQPFRN